MNNVLQCGHLPYIYYYSLMIIFLFLYGYMGVWVLGKVLYSVLYYVEVFVYL